jgi:hypothetical protein
MMLNVYLTFTVFQGRKSVQMSLNPEIYQIFTLTKINIKSNSIMKKVTPNICIRKRTLQIFSF